MKRFFIISAFVLCSFTAWSQTMNIHYKNGQTIEYNMDNIDYVEFTEKKENNTQVSSEKAVDLGLSVKWASCNVGASSPEQFGDMYAWGETSTKDKYDVDTYTYYNLGTQSYMDIGKDIGGTDYDAAHVKWGGNWRIPTYAEINELKDNCTWKWSIYNDVTGYVVIGPNGNSIFLPVNTKTCYWASDMYKYEENKALNTLTYAYCMGLESKGSSLIALAFRKNGHPIRPVMPK